MAPSGRKRKARSKKPQVLADPLSVYDFESDEPTDPPGSWAREEPSDPPGTLAREESSDPPGTLAREEPSDPPGTLAREEPGDPTGTWAHQPVSGDLCVPGTDPVMASAGMKHQERSGNSQLYAQALAVYDFESEDGRDLNEPEAIQKGSSPTVDDDSWGEVCSTGTFEEDKRKELRDMFEKFKEDIAKVHHEKRKSFQRSANASFGVINQKIERVWKTQEEQRKKLFHEYSQQFLTLFQEWIAVVRKVKEEEEKLAHLIQEQKKIFQQTRMVHHQKQKKLKSLNEEFLKSIEDLDKDQEHILIDEHGEVRQEMAALQNNIVMESQRQELAVVEKYLQSMLFW